MYPICSPGITCSRSSCILFTFMDSPSIPRVFYRASSEKDIDENNAGIIHTRFPSRCHSFSPFHIQFILFFVNFLVRKIFSLYTFELYCLQPLCCSQRPITVCLLVDVQMHPYTRSTSIRTVFIDIHTLCNPQPNLCWIFPVKSHILFLRDPDLLQLLDRAEKFSGFRPFQQKV